MDQISVGADRLTLIKLCRVDKKIALNHRQRGAVLDQVDPTRVASQEIAVRGDDHATLQTGFQERLNRPQGLEIFQFHHRGKKDRLQFYQQRKTGGVADIQFQAAEFSTNRKSCGLEQRFIKIPADILHFLSLVGLYLLE